MSQATVVVGATWGDEGKGRVVDYLAQSADFSIRFQGGANAGHTVINEHGEFALHQMPSGVFNPQCTGVLGPGMVINPFELANEVAHLANKGVQANFCISNRATLCLPLHVEQDCLEEMRLGDMAYGSTRQGIAPAYGDRVMKKGILAGWLNEPDVLRDQLQMWMDWKLPQLQALYPSASFGRSANALCEQLLEVSQSWRHHITDVTPLLRQALSTGQSMVFEAQLGSGRDLYYGEYPYTTSSSTLAGHAGLGGGIPELRDLKVIAVAKVYSSSVGTGTLPTAMDDGGAFREKTQEYGVTTGRPREVGHFDAPATRMGILAHGTTEVALTKLDCLGGEPELKVAVAYEGRKAMDNPIWPARASLKPVYRSLPGWQEDISDCRQY